MRKLGTIGALVMAAAILFTSCEKIETSELTLDLTQTATVRVKLLANLNLTTQGNELVPNGTKVIISIPNNAFNSTATGLWTTTVEVINGQIEATVPTKNDGVTVTFTPAEFIFAQVQPFGHVSSTLQKKFTVSQGTLSVKPGEVKYLEMTYLPSDVYVTETVTRKYELRADMVETNPAGSPEEYVPQNTVVTFYNDSFMTTATVGAAGVVTVTLPKSETVTARFEAIKTLIAPATPKKHRYTKTNISSGAESLPTISTLTFIDVLWE